MCIIAYYSKGLKLDYKELATCFENNSDGAGFMYQKNGMVHIEKGFMEFADLWREASKLPVDVDRVFHFRIATSGKVSSACCHPFPICDDYKKMSMAKSDSKMGFAHNGVLYDFEPKKKMKSSHSDSMAFGKEVLYKLGDAIKIPTVRDLIELYNTSRFAIMTNKETYLIGSWQQSRESSAMYSNGSYEPYFKKYTSKNCYADNWSTGYYGGGWDSTSSKYYSDSYFKTKDLLTMNVDENDFIDEMEAMYGIFITTWEYVGNDILFAYEIDDTEANLPDIGYIKVRNSKGKLVKVEFKGVYKND